MNSMKEFCPSFDGEWALATLEIVGDAVNLHVVQGRAEAAPEAMNRSGALVLAEPQVFREERRAEISFTRVIVSEIVDESYFGTDATERSAGTHFCLVENSEVLGRCRGRFTPNDPAAASLRHYRVFLSDHVVNVVTANAPTITFRR
jgi:hypothetical protein